MTQREVSESEWANPANRAGPAWLGVYFSRRNSQVLVPKRARWAGGTLNVGPAAGVVWLAVLLVALAVVPLAVAVAGRSL